MMSRSKSLAEYTGKLQGWLDVLGRCDGCMAILLVFVDTVGMHVERSH